MSLMFAALIAFLSVDNARIAAPWYQEHMLTGQWFAKINQTIISTTIFNFDKNDGPSDNIGEHGFIENPQGNEANFIPYGSTDMMDLEVLNAIPILEDIPLKLYQPLAIDACKSIGVACGFVSDSKASKVCDTSGRRITPIVQAYLSVNSGSVVYRVNLRGSFKSNFNPSSNFGFRIGSRDIISVSRRFQRSICLCERAQQQENTDQAQSGSDNTEPVRPYGGIRGFFSGNSSSPLSAQIGAIVILSGVAAVGLFEGVRGKPRIEWLRSITLCGSVGLLCLLVWLTSPVAT